MNREEMMIAKRKDQLWKEIDSNNLAKEVTVSETKDGLLIKYDNEEDLKNIISRYSKSPVSLRSRLLNMIYRPIIKGHPIHQRMADKL